MRTIYGPPQWKSQIIEKKRSRTAPLPLENMDIPRIPQLKIAGLHMNDYSQYWFQISTPVPKTSTSLF